MKFSYLLISGFDERKEKECLSFVTNQNCMLNIEKIQNSYIDNDIKTYT